MLVSRINRIENGNVIKGVFGSCYDGLLCKLTLRKCLIKMEKILGTKLPNSTKYNGALGMFFYKYSIGSKI